MTASPTFRERYESAAATNDSLLCVGLDPDPARIPAGVGVLPFLDAIVEATADLVCCFKPNAAFFESRGPHGVEDLRSLIAAIPQDVPVLLDAKRGDIGHSSAHYARAAFDQLGAHGVTVSPYLGRDAVEPFLAYKDRHSFVLCRTSNPGAGDFQDLPVGEGGRPLYLQVAATASTWNERGNVGLVVGATYPGEVREVRALCPDMLILMPGVGAQAGDIDAAVRAAVDVDGGGILVNASRGVLYTDTEGDYASAARREATRLRAAINAARRSSASSATA